MFFPLKDFTPVSIVRFKVSKMKVGVESLFAHLLVDRDSSMVM